MTDTPEYTPPEVWVWEKGDSPNWRYSHTNRPIAGATHEKELPRGKHPLQLYSQGTPNGVKVTIMLEELLAAGHSGAEYDAWLIRIGEGEQFGSGFVGVNPNSKIPALMDYSERTPQRVFESGAILLYLADKIGAFLPKDRGKRTEALNWLFWQMGSTPYVGGGFGHFYAYAPLKIKYAIDRFTMEVKRLLDVLDRHFADNRFIAGDDYTIADMAIWPWYGNGMVNGASYNDPRKFLPVEYDTKFEDYYIPSHLDSNDYPSLVSKGERIATIAVPTILSAYNWAPGTDRYRRVARFVHNLFGNVSKLQAPGFDPKWNDINLSARVPGLERFRAAQEWLDQANAASRGRRP